MIDICMALWNKIQWRKCLIIACIITSLGASLFILWVTINHTHETARKPQQVAAQQTKGVARVATGRIASAVQAQGHSPAPDGNALKPANTVTSTASSKPVQPVKNGAVNKGNVSAPAATPTVVTLPPHPVVSRGKRATIVVTPTPTPDDTISVAATPTPDVTATAQGEQASPGFVMSSSVGGKKNK